MRTFLSVLVSICLSSISVSQNINTTFGTNGYIHFSDESDHDVIGLQKIDSSFIVATTLLETDGALDYSIRLFKYNQNGELVTTWGDNGILTFDIPGYTHTLARTIVVDGSVIRIACEAANTTSEQRRMVILELNEDGSFNTSFGGTGYKTLAFDNVTQNNIVKYYQKGDQHLLIGSLYRTFDFETNQYPFIIKLDENLDPDSSFNGTGRFVIDNYRGHSNARPTHLEGGEAKDVYINDNDEIVFIAYELMEPYHEEYICKFSQAGEFIHHTGMTPYMEVNNKIGIFYNRVMLLPDEEQFTMIHSYFTGTKFQYAISQKDSLGQLSYLTTDNTSGYHHVLKGVAPLGDKYLAVGHVYETSASSSEEFFSIVFDPFTGTASNLWNQSFIAEQHEGAEAILALDDNEFIIGGFSQHPDSSYKDLLLVKINASTILGIDETNQYTQLLEEIEITNNQVTLPKNFKRNTWSLRSTDGKLITHGKASGDTLPPLPVGTYILSIQLKSGELIGKKIILH